MRRQQPGRFGRSH